MYNDRNLFVKVEKLDRVQNVGLGDGRTVKATGKGTVDLEMLLTGEKGQWN
jgi:hypothetical protein